MVIGISVVVAGAIAFFALSGGSKAPASSKQPAPVAAPTQQPAAAPSVSTLPIAAPKQGKAPTTPPPPLTQATLQDLSSLLDKVKALRNEAVTARTGSSDTAKAKAKMNEAHKLLLQWEEMVSAPLRWQEMAQMEEWAQPAEYMTLERLFGTFGRLNNEVRKGGGGG